MKVIRLQQPVLAVIVPMNVDPFHWAIDEKDFPRSVAQQGETGGQGMFETRSKGSACAMKISAGKFFFKQGDSDDDRIHFDGSARRRAGDFQGLGTGGAREVSETERNGEEEAGNYRETTREEGNKRVSLT